MTQSISQKTFTKAISTMNQAIEHNKQALFFQALLQACKSWSDEDLLGVAIYRDDPQSPNDYYTLCMQDGAFQIVGHGTPQPEPDWEVSETHVRDLARNRKKYINHPEKLSLNWLAQRAIALNS